MYNAEVIANQTGLTAEQVEAILGGYGISAISPVSPTPVPTYPVYPGTPTVIGPSL